MTSLTQQFVEVDGATLEVFRGGVGRPVVCCSHPHSPNLDACRWYAEHTELVYVVPRGLGGSSPIRDERDLTYLRVAHDLDAVRRTLGIGRWVVEGYSGGSQVALLYALAYPDALAGLIVGYSVANGPRALADPRSQASPNHPDNRAVFSAPRLRDAPRRPAIVASADCQWVQMRPGRWVLVRGDTPLIVMPDDQPRPKTQAAFEEVVQFDVTDRLGEIRVPALVVCGKPDVLVPLEHCAAIHDGIADSALLVLEHSGHGVDEAAANLDVAIFRETVRRFLAGLAG